MRIRVPASSANLGPGFDCFGIAWKLYDEIEFLPGTDRLRITGCPEAFRNRENLCYRGYTAALRRRGFAEEPVVISFLKCGIPICRGLGSSAALIVGGVTAANELHGLGFTKDELLSLALETEGHPDNIAAALLGGFTASAAEDGRVLAVKFKVNRRLHFTVLIPDFELSTAVSRSVLPDRMSRKDAVFNVSRSALLIKAMATGDTALMPEALQDRIHQPYRTGFIKGYDRIKEAACRLGSSGICLSGSGPSLLCVSAAESFSEKMGSWMGENFPKWRVLTLCPDSEGASVI